jgi:hypothetical protein
VGNYGSLEYHVPVVTVELVHALEPPTDVEARNMLRDLNTWMGCVC